MGVNSAKITIEDWLKAAPIFLGSLCEAQHSAEREFLYQRVLYGSLNRQDGSTVLSADKTNHLKEEANTRYVKLPNDLQRGLAKNVVKYFSAILYFVASQQLANVRMSKLLAEVSQLTTDPSIKRRIEEAQKQWEEGKKQGGESSLSY